MNNFNRVLKDNAHKVVTEEKGAVMLMGVALIVVLIIISALAVDFARVWVAREELQSAVDSAALAGSKEGTRLTTITIQTGHYECDEFFCWCECDPEYKVTGEEDQIFEDEPWDVECCGDYKGMEDRWIEFTGDPVGSAKSLFEMNKPTILASGGSVSEPRIYVTPKGDPRYPSVTVTADGQVDPVLLHWAGIDTVEFTRTGQSGVFFDAVKDGWDYGRNNSWEDGENVSEGF
ncbi:MAG: Tad domain-containing protein [Acidobacteriota bacterium]